MKQEFIDAKHKLELMEKLYKFHEDVMALSIPDAKNYRDWENLPKWDELYDALELYAESYCELLKQDLGASVPDDEIYEELKRLGYYKFDGAEQLIDCIKALYFLSVGEPYSWDITLVEPNCFSDRPEAKEKISIDRRKYMVTIERVVDALRDAVNQKMKDIEYVLKRIPKPKVNAFQKIFGRKKYFKMKRTVSGR